MELKGRKVVVLGLGDTGLSMARWLARRGADVRVADSRAEPPQAAPLGRELPRVRLTTGPFGDETLQDADLVAVSPGIDRREGPIAKAIGRGVPVVGDVELFSQALPSLATRHSSLAPKVVAITGSNGKSTVTAMAGAMCRAAGRVTVVAGNIGEPMLDALAAIEAGAQVPHVFVLELSSFQLESTTSLAPDAAAMLNLTEDHMDRYDGLDSYAAAKARVFNGNGVQVLNRDDRWSMSMSRAGRTILTFGRSAPRAEKEWGIAAAGGDFGNVARGDMGSVARSALALMHGTKRLLAVADLPVQGLHNAANALAAHALYHALGLPDEPAAAALKSFIGLPHRLQKVAEIEGVAFYDDSKGTNVGATVAALTGMGQTVVLIAGGDGKGQDFTPLAAAVAGRARAVVLIGRDATLIANALEKSGIRIERATGMDEAVQHAYAAARKGDTVLLSPACASYDMFRNYAHRGEAFVAAVRRLERGH
jgi:UDP-N-acetylmuramoylalanine--D-glutamate ligase